MPGTTSTKKRALIAIGSVIGALIVIVLAIPLFINVDRFRPEIESKLSSSLGREVKIGKLNLSIFAGGISAADIAIADDPAFSNSPFLQAKSLNVGVEWLPLITSRSLRIQSLTIQQPQVALLHNPAGKWNFSTLGGKGAATPKGAAPSKASAQEKGAGPAKAGNTPPSGAAENLSIQQLKIVNGRVTVGTAHAAAKQDTYTDVNLTASNISYGSTIPFTLEAKTPPDGTLKIQGNAGPLDQADMALTPLSASIRIEHLDLATTGFVDPASGIAGILDYDGTIKASNGTAHTEGKATIAQLRLVKAGTPAKQPVTVDYATDYDLSKQAGVLSKGDLHVGGTTVNVAGNYATQGESTVVHMKVKGDRMPIHDIEGLLPAVGVVLPAGASLQGGVANMDLALNGPVDRLVTYGPIDISNTKLAGFDLGSKLSSIAKLAGINTGKDTLIQTLSSNLQVAPEGIRADKLDMVIANLGSLTGAGTIGAKNQLNFNMVAKFAHSGNTIAGLANTVGLGSAKGGIPFLIQGTTSDPKFMPNVGAALSSGALSSSLSNLKNAQSGQSGNGLGGVLGGLLGGKKKPQ